MEHLSDRTQAPTAQPSFRQCWSAQLIEGWECPPAVEKLRLGPVEPYRVVPPLHDRDLVGQFRLAAEVGGHRLIAVRHRGDAVDRVAALLVLLELAVAVVDADRPEAAHRHRADRQAVVLGW